MSYLVIEQALLSTTTWLLFVLILGSLRRRVGLGVVHEVADCRCVADVGVPLNVQLGDKH